MPSIKINTTKPLFYGDKHPIFVNAFTEIQRLYINEQYLVDIFIHKHDSVHTQLTHKFIFHMLSPSIN